MMTPEEKQAAQTLVIDEIMTANQQGNTTLLIDALLSDNGFAFLHAILTKRAAAAQGAAQATAQLVRALRPRPEPIEEAS